MTGKMTRLLYHLPHDTDDLYYAGGFQNGARDPHNAVVIGVCETAKGDRPSHTDDFETFKEDVESLATDVRWFDEPLGDADP